MKNTSTFFAAILFIVLAIPAVCQTETPGLTNPTGFETYDPQYYWSGQVGVKMEMAPNSYLGITGSCFSLYPGDTCQVPQSWGDGFYVVTPKLPGIKHGEELDTISGCYNLNWGAPYDGDTSLQMEPQRHFRIMYNTDTRTPDSAATIGMDPYTQYQLPYCPPGFTSSVRIGNMGGGSESDALYYNMRVTSSNALLTIHYAWVVEDPGFGGHGLKEDPDFIIRVSRQDYNGNWIPVSDTMFYAQISTPCNNPQAIYGQCVDTSNHASGWHNNSLPSLSSWNNSRVYWKEWSKVTVNLYDYLFESVRIEVIASDCAFSAHFGYAYVAAESQPMAIKTIGCTEAWATAIDTLIAPEGLSNYIFYKQVGGPDYINTFSQIVSATGYQTIRTRPYNDTVLYTWERINRSAIVSAENRFAVEPEDFIASDSTYAGSMNFMCLMNSYMDPDKPMTTLLFTTVRNPKPIVKIDSAVLADGSVQLVNRSFVPYNNLTIDSDSTRWVMYADPDFLVPTGDTVFGDTLLLQSAVDRTFYTVLHVQTFLNTEGTGGCATERGFSVNVHVPNLPLEMFTMGCTEASSTDIDTLIAPEGMDNYIFYKGSGSEDFDPSSMRFLDTIVDTRFVSTIDLSDSSVYVWQRISDGSVSVDNRFAVTAREMWRMDEKNFMCIMNTVVDSTTVTKLAFAKVYWNKPNPIVGGHHDEADGSWWMEEDSYGYFDSIDHNATMWIFVYTPDSSSRYGDTSFGVRTGIIRPEDSVYYVIMQTRTYGGCASEWRSGLLIDTTHTGISNVDFGDVAINVSGYEIVVEGADGEMVGVYDVAGREVATRVSVPGAAVRVTVPGPGVYLVKVGSRPARKAVVIKR